MGDAIGADGVVLHPGSTLGEPHEEAIARAGEAFTEALRESELVPAAARGHGRRRATRWAATSASWRALIEAAGGDERIGLCLDSCHMLASGFDITTADKLAAVIDECVEKIGIDACGACT